MVYKIADNITSPLGMTTEQNYQAVKSGGSALRCYGSRWGLPEAFTAALFDGDLMQRLAVKGLTRFESLAVHSVRDALRCVDLDITASNVVLILSTTKGNIELIESDDLPRVLPGVAAKHIASEIGLSTDPIVACNACISGVTAVILASRLLEMRCYDYAIVCGADVQSKFTVSGFQSLKAVAEDACRPFDLERTGLNLGEAAATMILARESQGQNNWAIEAGAIRNDAFHISAPSRHGEGAYRALQAIGGSKCTEKTAFISAHGTATMFNDQMESVAIERAGLQSVPVNGLKGYYGHTLGAAGLLETVISMAAADDATILGTRGFKELGVSGKICLSPTNSPTNGQQSFIKMISGFGGGNAAVRVVKSMSSERGKSILSPNVNETHHVVISLHELRINNRSVESFNSLSDIYKKHVGDYPRFYKMDGLCQLGFLAAELLFENENCSMEHDTDRAVVLFNRSSSVEADLKYRASIADMGNFFPSPSMFVYTLPNIVTGEIAIRHHYHGETAFYVLHHRDNTLMRQVALTTFLDPTISSVITGWIDYWDKDNYEADFAILKRAE